MSAGKIQPGPHQPARIIAAGRDILAAAGCAEADRAVMRLLVSQFAARSGLPGLAWQPLPGEDEDAVYQARRHLAGLVMNGWDMTDIGAAYEHLLDPETREAGAVYYTPPAVAAPMARLSIGQAVDKMLASTDPAAVLHVMAVDPACGAGVFLVEAARFIATAYARRLTGRDDPALARVMMPQVMTSCVFGMDIDPVAIDLARAALWIEAGGTEAPGFMDDNVTVVNPLSGRYAQPPALAKRLGEPCVLTPGYQTPGVAPE